MGSGVTGGAAIGEDVRAAVALYGWEIWQAGAAISPRGNPILCSGKPAMTLVRKHAGSAKADVIYLPADISAEDLVKLLREESRYVNLDYYIGPPRHGVKMVTPTLLDDEI